MAIQSATILARLAVLLLMFPLEVLSFNYFLLGILRMERLRHGVRLRLVRKLGLYQRFVLCD